MRARDAAFAVLLFGVFAAPGCGSSPSSSDPGGIQPQLNGPMEAHRGLGAWTASFKEPCASDAPLERCSGAYGLTVTQDGTYWIGPGPQGQEFGGVLSDEELQQTEKIFEEAEATTGTFEDCTEANRSLVAERSGGEPIAKTTESVQFTLNDRTRSSCSAAIVGHFKKLVSRYYPSSFPNPCVDANQDLRRAYESVVTCERDRDCAFLDSDYLPLGEGFGSSQGDIILDDCTVISPLIAGNAFKAVSLQRDLIVKRERVKQVCGNDLRKPACHAERSFKSGARKPVCIENRCHVFGK
jgi:hypothetical protein